MNQPCPSRRDHDTVRTGAALAPALGAAVLGAAALGALAWARRTWTVVTVDGASMAPTLRPGDRVLVQRVAGTSLRVGQVVVLQRQAAGAGWETGPLPVRGVGRLSWYIKRIAALPGDPVPPELAEGAGVPAGTPVPEGRLLVLGDNPGGSFDSRRWGYVPVDRILGVVRRRMHP